MYVKYPLVFPVILYWWLFSCDFLSYTDLFDSDKLITCTVIIPQPLIISWNDFGYNWLHGLVRL
jgi:hypothetical protein